MLIAVFAVWVVPKAVTRKQLGIEGAAALFGWRLLAGVIAPLCVLAVFVYALLNG
jgi:hypothetical protein